MKIFIIVMLITLSSLSIAEESKLKPEQGAVKAEITKTDPKIEEVSNSIVAADKPWAIYGTYSYLDYWLPGKFGIVGSYGSDKRVYELAFQQATYSFDFIIDGLGKITDRRIHLTTRSFWGNSFNFQYGVNFNQLSIRLGNIYTDIAGVTHELVEITTLGSVWAVGNRWSLDNGVSFGLDWLKVFWPIKVLSKDVRYLDQAADSDEKDDVKKLIDTIGKVPTFSILHFELGYKF